MNKNYFKMPYGPWKGQNVFEVVKTEEGKTYVAGSMWGAKKDLSEMDKGIWAVPFGKFKGKLFQDIPENMQNYFRIGTKNRYVNYSKAISLSNVAKKNKLQPSDVVDKYQIIDLLYDAVGFKYAKRSIDNMLWKFQNETNYSINFVGTKAIAGRKGRLRIFLKEDIQKFIDWVVGSRGGESYSFFE